MNIRSILCPTDFSDASRHALDHAVAIAKWYSARIIVLHAHHPVSAAVTALVAAGGGGIVDDSDAIADEGRQLATAIASMQMDELARPCDVELETKVLSGAPEDTIVSCAAAEPVDLIVIGTHGAGGFEHLVLGSVTEKVLRRAKCPVLTVPPRAHATSRLPFKRILCPTDFSSSAHAGLRLAFSFAQEGDAALTLLHVIDEPDENELFVARTYDVHRHRALHEQQALSHLGTLVPDSVREWSSPKLRVAHGKPHEQILAVAAEERPDLIVVGVQGRKPLDLMLFGSTTNQVVRRATCPVLTVRQ
jgi:nucleotide-binding universal stress UspA family protein